MTTIDAVETGTRGAELLTVTEAARELRIGRSLAYQLARLYVDSAERDGLPVIKLGAACLRVPRWALDELKRTGRVVALHDTPTAPRA